MVISTGKLTSIAAVLVSTILSSATASSDVIAPRCAELFSQTEQIAKVTDKRSSLGDELDRTYWKTLSPDYTHAQYNAMARNVHQQSESAALSASGIGKNEATIRDMFDRARAIIIDSIRSDQSLPLTTKDMKILELNKVRLVLKSDDFISAKRKSYNEESPDASFSEDGLTFGIYGILRESCGRNGLSPNAFHRDDIDVVFVCPGLLVGLKDFGGSSEDQAAALMFTLGHELGHAIDQPFFGYLQMGYCYSQITGYASIWDLKLANEIIADHWGTVVLAEVLRTRPGGAPTPDQVVRVIALASDGWDERTAANAEVEHPPTIFRVNQTIGRHPAMNDLLACPPAGEPNPTCTMSGKVPT